MILGNDPILKGHGDSRYIHMYIAGSRILTQTHQGPLYPPKKTTKSRSLLSLASRLLVVSLPLGRCRRSLRLGLFRRARAHRPDPIFELPHKSNPRKTQTTATRNRLAFFCRTFILASSPKNQVFWTRHCFLGFLINQNVREGGFALVATAKRYQLKRQTQSQPTKGAENKK